MYTLKEIKQIFEDNGSTFMFPKTNIWIAVWDDEHERKDWFSLGEECMDNNNLGVSHWDRFKEYPSWGDDPERTGMHMAGIIYKKSTPWKGFEFPGEVWSMRETARG